MRPSLSVPVLALVLLCGCATAPAPREAAPERSDPAIVPLTLEQEWEMRS